MVELSDATQDERSMAALAHIGVILPLWGLVLAVALWLTQREKSPFVVDQGRQAIAWQVTQIVLTFIGFACYAITLITLIVTASSSGSSGNTPPPGFLLAFIIFGLLGAVTLGMAIVGMLAAYRAYKGERYRYPIIGRRVAG